MPIIPLSQATPDHNAGGKAIALGELLRAELPVPPGFVVTSFSASDSSQLLDAFDALGVKRVAVRSSAAAEDGKTAAWAGQLDSFLGVTRELLIEQVEKCMQSACTPRAQAYAEQKGITPGEVAVIVQAMVASDISGVAFSTHPITKSADQIVLEAALGLGEAVVSGAITPDTYVISAADGSVLEQVISPQSQRLLQQAGGGTYWQALEPAVAAPKLGSEQLQEVAAMVTQVADLYGFPVDIEWAYQGASLYLLQARPITSL